MLEELYRVAAELGDPPDVLWKVQMALHNVLGGAFSMEGNYGEGT